MIAELTTAILEKLKKSGLDIREIAFKDLVDKTINLTRPAVNIAINTADYQKVTLYSYKAKLTVSLIIIFQHLKAGVEGEARRKEGIYKIIEGVTNALMIERLDLPLENPLFPVSFRNITNYELAKAGFQLYQLNFWTSVIFSKEADEDEGTLSSLVAQYYLEPRNYTGMQGVTGPEAYDILNLT